MKLNGRSGNPFLLFIVAIIGALFISSCTTDPIQPENQYGKIRFTFNHKVDGEDIIVDDMRYVNEAGNQYLVNEIQYFISEVTIHTQSGDQILLDDWEDIHYVDTDIEESKTYALKDEVLPGNYSKITFTFGINDQKNQSLMFVNPPKSLMFWPELLGGGYHYMKLNGKWLDTLNQVSPFNFHLGIGQIYYSFPDSISEYVDNSFLVELSNSSFEINANKTTDLTIVMNVENWFKEPNIYNHDDWGGDIMQKQDAMKLACENGWNVFSVEK